MAAAAVFRAIGAISGAWGRVARTSRESLNASGDAPSPADAARLAPVHFAEIGVKASNVPVTRAPARSAPYCIGEGAPCARFDPLVAAVETPMVVPSEPKAASSRIWFVRARKELTKLQATPPFFGVRLVSWPSELHS